MFSFVRLSEGGAPEPPGEARSEVEVVCALAARLLPPGPFSFERLRDHKAIREEIARVAPGLAAIGTIDETRREFAIDGRTFHEPRFPTATGRVHVFVPRSASWAPEDGAFRLTTLRSEGQFNTVVYEDEDLYRGTTRRDVVLMHPDDAVRLGVREGDAVTVATDAGTMRVVVAHVDIRPGNVAMYYPEANRLVPRRIDAASGTPAFKSISAHITRAE
jgi:anaerobic selenocysteine-containing dehydrogenase